MSYFFFGVKIILGVTGIIPSCFYYIKIILFKFLLFIFILQSWKPGNSNSEGKRKTVRVSGGFELSGSMIEYPTCHVELIVD